MTETKSTCPYCGVGCGLVIEVNDGGADGGKSSGGKITGVRGDENHPANFGKLCSKGSTLHLTLNPGARALSTRPCALNGKLSANVFHGE